MKMKEILKQALGDRGFVIALIAGGVVLLAIIVLSLIEIKPNELQVPIRNTVFGITYTYREKWYNELSFVGFAVLVGVLNTFIAAKLYATKDRRYGIGFEWLTAAVLLICFLVLVAIFNVISVVE